MAKVGEGSHELWKGLDESHYLFDDATLERFESRIDRSGGEDACHTMIDTTRIVRGYVQFSIKKVDGTWTNIYAHRLAFYIANGYLPVQPLETRHLCHNRQCVNHKHLAVGTRIQNRLDSALDGRLGKKLTDEDVEFILTSDLNTMRLAEMFGVTDTVISQIQRGKIWKHVDGPKRENHQPKLTQKDVVAIRESDKSSKELAIEFGVSVSTITQIQVGSLYSSIGGPIREKHTYLFNESDIISIRERYADRSMNMYQLADEYGTTAGHICNIVKGKVYKEFGGPISIGNTRTGEDRAGAKLTTENVLRMRHLYESGQATQKELAAMYSVKRNTVNQIVNYRTWKHLGGNHEQTREDNSND